MILAASPWLPPEQTCREEPSGRVRSREVVVGWFFFFFVGVGN